MTPNKTTEQPIPSDAVARMIQAQIGTKEQSDLISSHMDEYFKRFSSYRSKFTDLEWYHIFLDFSDKLNSLPPSPVDAKPFGLSDDELRAILDQCMKPEEIAGPKQHDRLLELIRWFSRGGNPKWFHSHAFELVYYIASNSVNRFVDLEAVREKAYYEGVNIPANERSLLERHFPEKITQVASPVGEAGKYTRAELRKNLLEAVNYGVFLKKKMESAKEGETGEDIFNAWFDDNYPVQPNPSRAGEISPVLRWVKIGQPLPEPPEMPEFDEFVLWRREDGHYFVSEIDKDDYDWWNGRQTKDPLKDGYETRIEGTKCTHWARIPFEEAPPTPAPEPKLSPEAEFCAALSQETLGKYLSDHPEDRFAEPVKEERKCDCCGTMNRPDDDGIFRECSNCMNEFEPVKDTPIEHDGFYCSKPSDIPCHSQCVLCAAVDPRKASPFSIPQPPTPTEPVSSKMEHTLPKGEIPEEIMEWIRYTAKELCELPTTKPDIIISHEKYSLAALICCHEMAIAMYRKMHPEIERGLATIVRRANEMIDQRKQIAILTSERDTARQEGDVKNEKIQQAHADIRYWKEEYERVYKEAEEFKTQVGVFMTRDKNSKQL